MAHQPLKTTVVLAVWDDYAGPSLKLALRSLDAQDTAFALVLVDNASRSALPSPEPARIVRSKVRLTLGAARNLGLEQVSTPYVLFWDADDEMLPNTLQRLEGRLDADPGVVAFGMAIQEQPSGRRHRWPRRYLAQVARFPRMLSALEPVWAQFPTTGATIIRTQAARESGGFADADSGEDWCLGVSLAFRGRIGWSEEPGRIYRLHPESMWARHLTVSHQRQHAKAVRERLRTDPGVPGWIRRASGVVWAAQGAALAAHVLVAAVRRRSRPSAGQALSAAERSD